MRMYGDLDNPKIEWEKLYSSTDNVIIQQYQTI